MNGGSEIARCGIPINTPAGKFGEPLGDLTKNEPLLPGEGLGDAREHLREGLGVQTLEVRAQGRLQELDQLRKSSSSSGNSPVRTPP